tara:strand:- start:125 stop:442 length:318 start_codon:yes stop_codon:yes gene_type:complete
MDCKKLQPKCLLTARGASYTATGYVLPCCWIDNPKGWNDEILKKFFDPNLHIDKNEIEEIINSKTWKNFFNLVKNNPKQAPKLCYRYCSVNKAYDATKKVTHFKK